MFGGCGSAYLSHVLINSEHSKGLRMSLTGVSAVCAGSLFRGCSSAYKVHVFHLKIVASKRPSHVSDMGLCWQSL